MADPHVLVSAKDVPMVKRFLQSVAEVRDMLDEAQRYRGRSEGWPFVKSARSMLDQALLDLGQGKAE